MRRFVFVLFLGIISSAACSGTRVSDDPPESTSATDVRISAEGLSASESGIAARDDGGVTVVWSERDASGRFDVYVRAFDAALKPLAERVRVNPNPGEAKTWYGDPPTIAVSGQNVYVGWNRIYSDGSSGNDLMLSSSTDGGASFAEPLKINDDEKPASHGMHGLAVDGRGRVLIAWLDERYISADKPRTEGYLGISSPFAMFHHTKATTSQEPDAELYFAIVENGMVGPNRKIGSGICPCCRVAVLAADAGNVYVGYRKVYTGAFRHVAVSSSGDGGATFGDPIQVSDDRWKLYACPVTGPALASSAGVLEVAWYSGGERSAKGVYACRMRPDGKGFSEPALLFEGSFKGSPEFAGSATIFGDQENVYKSGGTGTAPSPIVKGSMPASAVAGGKLYIAYTARSGDATSIRLTVK